MNQHLELGPSALMLLKFPSAIPACSKGLRTRGRQDTVQLILRFASLPDQSPAGLTGSPLHPPHAAATPPLWPSPGVPFSLRFPHLSRDLGLEQNAFFPPGFQGHAPYPSRLTLFLFPSFPYPNFVLGCPIHVPGHTSV